jgi:hypothetical protein
MTTLARTLDELVAQKLDRRGFLQGGLALSVGAAAFYVTGCGSGDEATPATPGASLPALTPTSVAGTPVASGVTPVLLTGEFVANRDSRFLVGLLDADNELLRNAKVDLKFFTVNADGASGKLRGEGTAAYFELQLPEDASAVGTALGEKVGFYSVTTPFDVAGKWAVEITATPPGASEASTVQAAFDVYDQYRIPGVGTVPPASQNDTAATNPNTASLCSRVPACSLHDTVIADVLGKGRPLVVQFSTPAFCETRFCGPVLDVLLEEVPVYQDRIDFVHIEVWQDFQLKQYRPATQEWKLPTEPITFFMGPDGKVVSFLEAIFSREELLAALDALVG